MYPSSLSLCSALLVLATGASAAVGTMCRNQDPNQSCGAAAVATVSPPCEAYDDQSVKTSCICSTLSKIASCYESLCPRDNLNDIYDSKFNSMSCPNAPPLTQGLGYTTATATAANTGGRL
ncbi:hypothetical protein B0T18DRAFT_384981 [Schizothecium vesticola]|uniref:Extracellular membrane protein CFEM domain-containing protein n=1 Tax=Schizothecium vesticola TaxID=314040 RepID=A0AA40F7T7_9PEZI|nr:hypothetical protein B0T18DRAFT_384981 [Schizothecium vesticola]